MSWFTSLRDSVESGIGAVTKSVTGLNITPALSVGAGGVRAAAPVPASASKATAAPSGYVAQGGVPNQNPTIFGKNFGVTEMMIIFFGAILLLFVARR